MKTLNEVFSAAAPPWVAWPLARRGTITLISGAPGTGKSNLVLAASVAASARRRFLGWESPTPVRTLYLSLDSPYYDMEFCAQRIARGLGVSPFYDDEGSPWPPFYLDYEPIDLMRRREGGVETLQQRLRTAAGGNGDEIDPVDLLIIDTLSDCHSGDENMVSTAVRVITHLRSISKHLAIVLLHHDNKPGQNPAPSIYRPSGSHKWPGKVDNCIRVSSKKGNFKPEARGKYLKLEWAKGRGFDLPESLKLIQRWGSEIMTFELQEEEKNLALEEARKAFLQRVEPRRMYTWNHLGSLARGIHGADLKTIVSAEFESVGKDTWRLKND